jgi:hypothetical protein
MKQLVSGPFPGGDPRKFNQVAEICTPEQINLHRVVCEHWNKADAERQILSDVAAEYVPDNATQSDYEVLNFGRGIFEVEKAASEPEPSTELDEAAFNEIMAAPTQKLPFKAVPG